MQGILGIVVFILAAWALSEDRRRPPVRVVAAGVALQFLLALAMLRLPVAKTAFMALNRFVLALEHATRAGTSFVFGYLGGGELPFAPTNPGATFVLALQSLPLVLVVSAVASLLFYWRVIPVVVRGFALVLQKTMGVSGALGVAVAANIFVGMIEAPVFVRPYLARMSRSELFTLMTSGMATIAGTVMALYATFLRTVLPDAVGHILVASVISAPAAVLVARLMVPSAPGEAAEAAFTPPQDAVSSMDAVTKGTAVGVQLFINIAAMLIVLVALVALVNQGLAFLPDASGAPLTLERIFGVLLRPVAWLMGVPWPEAGTAGMLLGVKTVLNELLAYLQMAGLPDGELSLRSRIIMTYALCGFANFGSLGIMIGGLATMMPERRTEIAGLGMNSILAGLLATCMTGAVVGLLY
ncbi:MAG: nucleoside:proton symporter [Desulfovibrionaceae bacterium]|jgi:CNT family concentrative nucleoside transporter|nr:nucleoside:proton symporter [Desulfovibrionaceae bacterium]